MYVREGVDKRKTTPRLGLFSPGLGWGVGQALSGPVTALGPVQGLTKTFKCVALSSRIDVARASRSNRRQAVQRGWNARRGDVRRLLSLPPDADEVRFAAAVAYWQCVQGLKVDGILGPNTWAAMQRALGAPVPSGTVGSDALPRGPFGTIVVRDGYKYELQPLDVLWGARMVYGEGGSDPGAVLWATTQRFAGIPRRRELHGTYRAMLRRWSEPLMADRLQGGAWCARHPNSSRCTPIKMARRALIQSLPWHAPPQTSVTVRGATARLNVHRWDAAKRVAIEWAMGRLPNSVPRAIDMLYSKLQKHPPYYVVKRAGGNTFWGDPRLTKGWADDHVQVHPPSGSAPSHVLRSSPPIPRPSDTGASTLEAFVTQLGKTWSRGLGGSPTGEAIADWLRRDHRATVAAAKKRYERAGKRVTVAALTRAWMISRESQMKFRTVSPKPKPLRGFRPPHGVVQRVSTTLISGSDTEPVAPLLVRFVKELRQRYPSFSVYTYPGHGGGSFRGKGFSLDLELTKARDDRGFYRPKDALQFLRAVDRAATAVNAEWRVIYNDFIVADRINKEMGRERAIFVGRARKDGKNVNWHGPHPLVLHFHLDLAPR